jgi:hypothetical protein
MCYGITSNETMRPAVKVFTRRGDSRLVTPGFGPATNEVVPKDRWILAPTPHGWHVFGDVKETAFRRDRESETTVVRIVWVAARAALCSRGWALIYVPSNPLSAPPKPPLHRVPAHWQKIRSSRYGSFQRRILASVFSEGVWLDRLSKVFRYRISALESVERVVNDMGWKLSYDRFPCDVRVTA